MIKVITVDDLKQLLQKVTLKTFFLELIEQLRKDYSRWNEFQKSPRQACYYPEGVIELMPVSDSEYHAFKYVNGHPGNVKMKKRTILGLGQLSLTSDGCPLMISEMTVLTAIRTAATSAFVSQYLARKNSKKFGIIGTGSQSEFQVLAHHFALNMNDIYYYDKDPHAMEKFARNLKPFKLNLHPCTDAKSVVDHSDIITTATAQKGHFKVIEAHWVKNGTHVNKIGGDSAGKTELGIPLVEKSKVVVELLEQTLIEGEIQQMPDKKIYAELWEIVTGRKKGRESEEEITLFDSVGFALEDYSALLLTFRLAKEYGIGHSMNLIPEVVDPKDLFGVIR